MKLGKIEPLGQITYAAYLLATAATIITTMSRMETRTDAAIPLLLIGVSITHYFYSIMNTEVENIKSRLDKIEPRENEVELKVNTND